MTIVLLRIETHSWVSSAPLCVISDRKVFLSPMFFLFILVLILAQPYGQGYAF